MNTKAYIYGGMMLVGVGLFWAQAASATNYAAIDVRIENPEGTEYNETVYINDADCRVEDVSETEHDVAGFSAVCALEAAAQDGEFEYVLNYDETYGLFLDAIGAYASGAEYWSVYVNLETTSTGIADTILEDGDELLFSYGTYEDLPLRLRLNKTHVVAGNPVVATVDYYVYDWMLGEGSYVPLAGATVTVGNHTFETDDRGRVTLELDTPRTFTVRTIADGFTRSVQKTLYVYPAYEDMEHDQSVTRQERMLSSIEYMREHYDDDTVVDESLVEWIAQALAVSYAQLGQSTEQDEMYQNIQDLVLEHTPTAAYGTYAVARHILALEAMGMDSRNSDGIDYVARLKKTIYNAQFGAEEHCNDDIFAGLALVSADEPFSSRALRRAMRGALRCQNDDGGVGFSLSTESDVDMTASFLMLAGFFKQHAGEHNIALKDPRRAAFEYLDRAQHPDGGFGYNIDAVSNSSSTAWAAMAYRSHGIRVTDIKKNKLHPFDFLASVQGSRGGIQYDTEGTDSSVRLNTAYTLMAWSGVVIGER